MNKIVLFTDSRVPLKHFLPVEKSSKWDLETIPVEKLRKTLRTAAEDTIFFLDYDSVQEENRTKDLNYLIRKQDTPRAVLDRKNSLPDPAELLMKGCDYFGPAVLKNGVKPGRLNKYLEFFRASSAERSPETAVHESPGRKNSTQITTPNGWKDVKSGNEYSFYMLFTEISLPSEWKKKSGNLHLNQLKQTFHNVAERISSLYDGRIWIWNEYGGLILFPYTGQDCNAVLTGIKLMLDRVIFSIEDFSLHTPIRLRTAMHLGKTTWKARGKTGTIISDSLNSIFHLGTKFTPLDDMDITEEVYGELPAGIRKMFSDAGCFEDRNIYRLCHFEVIS